MSLTDGVTLPSEANPPLTQQQSGTLTGDIIGNATSISLTPIDLLHPYNVATVAEEAHAGLGTSLMNAVASGIPWKTVAMKLLVLAAEEFIAWAKEQPAQTPPINQ